MANEKTITALSTPPGVSGLAVIRLSGKDAFAICNRNFKSKIPVSEMNSHTIAYGKFYDADTLIDTVTVSVFRSPNSYTGEDVVEISSHGGPIIYNKILSILIESGAEFAEAGEFTRRAFINGKLDLLQTEAVADMIHSSSGIGVETSARQLQGKFTERLNEFRETLLNIASLLELELDFSEEGLKFTEKADLIKRIEYAAKYCRELHSSFKTSEILRSGYFVSIAGYPNSGKSTLFNKILERNRAIVSDIPGTTRDYLEESIFLDGITIRLFDTAGIRESDDIIEIEGIKLVYSLMEQANLIIVLNDLSVGKNYSNGLFDSIKSKFDSKDVLLVHNKSDITAMQEDEISISAKTGEGIDKLKSLISERAHSDMSRLHDVLINQRHHKLLSISEDRLLNAINGLMSGMENEIIAIDIRDAAKHIGEITGESWNEEVLNNIFSRFCIGK